jgi:ribulose-phosphate 3-epimerase
MRAKHSVIPGDLTTTVADFENRLSFARQNAGAIHIDVADGEFVETLTLPIKRWPKLAIPYAEAHLMVKKPLPYLDQLKKAEVTRAIIHIESYFDPEELSSYAREIDMLLGFAINPETDLDYVRPFLEISNYVQVMGIEPGKTGQQMLPQTPLAVSYLRRVPNKRLVISVDCGVNKNNIAELNRLGASYFIASSAIYAEKDWQKAYSELLEMASA